MRNAVRAVIPKNEADRRMDIDIQAVLGMYRRGELPIGEIVFDVPGASA